MHVELLRFQDKSKWRQLYERSVQCYWQPSAIDVQADKNQWLEMDKPLKRKVMGLLNYAIALDSYQIKNIQAEGVNTDEPMLSALLALHSAMEAVHSQSYSYWAESVCTTKQKKWLYQQSEMLDSRMQAYSTLLDNTNPQLANYFLEGVSFQALFRLSDILKSQGLLPGLSAILALIKRDEDLHIETFQNILGEETKYWTESDYVYFKAQFQMAVEHEANQILEITEDKSLSDHVRYAGEVRMKAIKLINKVSIIDPLKHLSVFNDTTKQKLKENFFTSNVTYSQKDESLDWDVDSWLGATV